MRDATSTAEDLAKKHSGGDLVAASSRLPKRGKQRAGASIPPTPPTKKDVPLGAAVCCVRVGVITVTYGRAGLSFGLRPSIWRCWPRRVSGSLWWTRRSGRPRAVGNICGACTMRGVLPRPAAWFGGLRRRASRTGGVGGGVRSRRAQSARPLGSRLAFRSCGRQVGAAWSCAGPRR